MTQQSILLGLDIDHTHINPYATKRPPHQRWIDNAINWFNFYKGLQREALEDDIHIIPAIITFRQYLGEDGRAMFLGLHDLFPNDTITGVTYDYFEYKGCFYSNRCCLVESLYYNPITGTYNASLSYQLLKFDPHLPWTAKSEAQHQLNTKTLPPKPQPHVVLCHNNPKFYALKHLASHYKVPLPHCLMIDDDPKVLNDLRRRYIPIVSARKLHPTMTAYHPVINTCYTIHSRGSLDLPYKQLLATVRTIRHECRQQVEAIKHDIKRQRHYQDSTDSTNCNASYHIACLPTLFNRSHTRQPFRQTTLNRVAPS